MGKNRWQAHPFQNDPIRNPFLVLVLLLIILTVAFLLRYYKINKSPPGFYTDEASIGYNAYSILKTGKDEHNITYPLFFKAFGEYKNPVFIYSLIPLIAINGLRVETIRMGASLWGSLGILSLFWLARSLTKNNGYAIISVVILSLMPWHLHYSRLAFEAITFPTLLTISLVFFQNWLVKKRPLYSAFAGISLGLTFYTYTTARFWVPVFTFLLILLFKKELAEKKQGTILFLTFIALTILPVFFWENLPILFWKEAHPGSLTGQFRSIAVWNGRQNIKDVFSPSLRTFLGHWHPKFLFYSGDNNIRHSSRVSSELLLSWGPLFIAGIVLVFKYLTKWKIWKFIFILIITFPLAASLTRTSPIATRTLHATPFFALIIAFSIWWIIKNLSESKRGLVIGLGILAMAFAIEFSFYYYHLIQIYPTMSWHPWHGFDGSLPQTIQWAEEKRKKESLSLYLSSNIEQAYIQGLFFTRTNPHNWQEHKNIPFEVISVEEGLPSAGLAVLTKKECQDVSESKVLKKFGRVEREFDYCVINLH